MPVIIVEGPDESGKTTYARALGERLGVDVVHSPVKQTGWQTEYKDWAYKHAVRPGLTVLDRTPEISEMVYGMTIRGHSRINPWDFILDWVSMPVFVVMMTPNQAQYEPDDTHFPAGSRAMSPSQHQAVYGAYLGLLPWLQKASRTHLYRTATIDRYMGITYSMADASIDSWLLNFPTVTRKVVEA